MKSKVRIIYGVFSYSISLALMLGPSFSVTASPSARIIAFVAGAFLLASALLTNYELGVYPLLKFREGAFCTALGSIVVFLTGASLNSDGLLWLLLLPAAVQLVVAVYAYKIHCISKQRFA